MQVGRKYFVLLLLKVLFVIVFLRYHCTINIFDSSEVFVF